MYYQNRLKRLLLNPQIILTTHGFSSWYTSYGRDNIKSILPILEKIIKNGWCQILGSDSHDNKRRNFCLLEAVELIQSWGEYDVDAMVLKNPKAVIDGAPISVDFEYEQEQNSNFFSRIKDRIGLS